MKTSRNWQHVSAVLNNETIYKYYDAATSIRALNERTIQFSHASIFNDPFDCNVNLFDITEEDTRAYFTYISKKYTGNNYVERLRLKRNYEDKIKPNYKSFMRGLFEMENAERGITCFSKLSNNLLMWAHYASRHSGVCIGYDTLQLRNLIVEHHRESAFWQVNYVDKIQPKKYFLERDVAIDYWFTTKHKDWAYEQEVRLISRGFKFDTHNKRELFKIPSDVIKEVYFGYATTEDTKKKIFDISQSQKAQVRFYQIVPNYDSFELEARQLA